MTEYLDLGFADFVCFNVYLHRTEALTRYLARLQNLAGPRPIVLSEFGADSLREGEEEQARIREHYGKLMYRAVLNCTKQSLAAIKKRVGSRASASTIAWIG